MRAMDNHLDYADEIVNEAMEHKLEIQDGLVRCNACGSSVIGTAEEYEAHPGGATSRHRLYVAVTKTTERVTRMMRLMP